MSHQNILESQLEALQAEISLVREALQKEMRKNGDAENALKFYASPRSYKLSRREEPGHVYQDLVQDDFTSADNDPRTLIAGRRAREYFKAYGVI